ncbi:Mur ligase [Collybia nuda]|uniref:Mur ligase n=1 Tax=Collybia nuda TaxID=64659 RepID=A0A9P6CIB8_9AGAR|nr:Mur ligase [Collybia nuda]
MSIDLSLDRLHRLVGHLPTYTRPTCHIAGTNGKGSVSSLLSSIIYNSSLSFGRYNSPHLVSIYDCIVINNEPVKPDAYARAKAEVERADKEHETKLSSFELLTLTALYIFEEAKLDIVVIEVGMGGRLDATNIIPDEAILVSALTAVDLDHQAFLGNTVADITKEKAGIARKGRPFVLGPQKHGEVAGVVKSVVEGVGGQVVEAVHVVKRPWTEDIDGVKRASFREPSPQPVTISLACFSRCIRTLLPLYGEHQLDNLGVAVSIVSELITHPSSSHLNLGTRITPETVSEGIKSVRWPGRLSFHELPASVVLADGAHNPASSTTLGAYITHLLSLSEKDKTINITYVLSLSHSPPKTPLQTLAPILPPKLPTNPNITLKVNVAVLRFTPPEGMPWVKSVPPSVLGDVVAELAPEAGLWVAEEDSNDQLENALTWAADVGQGGLVVLAGSLYLVADFYRLIEKTLNM